MIYLDNARCHKGLVLKETLEEEVKLYFCPPYSPMLNPIEYVFNSVKQKFKQKISNSTGEVVKNMLSGFSGITKVSCRKTLLHTL